MEMSKENSTKMYEEILRSHGGLLSVNCKMPVKDRNALSLVYSPGVASSCKVIEKDFNRSYDLTNKKNAVLIVSDGSALKGKIIDAVLPYVEAVCVYYKLIANIDAYPLLIDPKLITSNEDFQETVRAVMPAFSYVEFVACDRDRIKNFSSNNTFCFADGSLKENFFVKNQCDVVVSPNIIYAGVIRAALDLQAYYSLHECIEYIFKYLQNSKGKN
jgi:malic enzyme